MARQRKTRTPSTRTTSSLPETSLVRVVDRPLFYGGPDPITLNRMESLVNNIRTMQLERRGRSSGDVDPRRDINEECGYPDSLSVEEYRDLIDREPIAGLVNSIYPLESWQDNPQVYEDDDEGVDTDFELAYAELPKQLSPEPSYYEEERGSMLNEVMLHADVLAGYGRYSIVLIGLKDGKRLDEPASFKNGQQLTYLQAFPEYLARISSFETAPSSPRFGMPLTYEVWFSDPRGDSTTDGAREVQGSTTVHWTRVVPIVDRWHAPSPSRNFAVPRVYPVLNPVLDVRKVRGSSAEMYYRGAFFGLHFGTHPQLGPDVDVDRESLRDMYEEYQNGLQRALYTSGMTVDPLAPQVVEPNPQIEVQLDAIAIRIRCPKRILVGSERGELASGDDKKKWNGRLSSRRRGHNTPRVVVPLTDRFINLGVLPKPKLYKCWWPDLASDSAQDKATVLLTRTQAYAAYAQGVETIVPPLEFMTKFDSIPNDEAEAILAASAEAVEGDFQAPAPLLSLVGGVDAILAMFEKFQAKAISEETLKQLIMLFYKVPEDQVDAIIADGLPEQPELALPAIPAFGKKPAPGGTPPTKGGLPIKAGTKLKPGGGGKV